MHSFRTPGLGLLKTFVMVIGEFEYDSGFSDDENSQSNPPAFAYILFLLFIIIMTILLMNLLVRNLNRLLCVVNISVMIALPGVQ